MFKKNKKEVTLEEINTEVESPNLVDLTEQDEVASKQFYQGARSLKDYIAPPAFYRGDETYLQVGTKFVRSFSMQGYPREIEVGWLRDLYSYEGDMDTVLYIEPVSERTALDELTHQIAQKQAELMMEREKGSIAKVTELEAKIAQLYQERINLEQQFQRQFQASLCSNLYADDLKDLKQRTEKLDNKFKGRHIYHQPNVLRQDEGYKTALPFGKNYIPDTYRNMNSGALAACFPFYNAELMHPNGVYLGHNLSTSSPVFIDLFDRTFVNNSNALIIGESGSGKTVTVSAFVYRNALRGVRTTIIDPERDYASLAESLGGVNIVIAPGSNQFINPFDLEEEDEINNEYKTTGRQFVDIKGKVSDVLNLIGVMCAGELDAELRSIVSFLIKELYDERGMNEEPASLYIEDAVFNEETGEFYYTDVKKKMPTFSDFHDKLTKHAKETGNPRLESLSNTLLMFKKGGIYDLFDCETSDNLKHYNDAPIVNFDVRDLEEDVLRPIGMYVALSYAWERFGKKTPDQKKFIVCDEAWMLFSKNMKGHEYTGAMLEKMARRFRKRVGGLITASQRFKEFASSDEGEAVLMNSALNMFLRTKPADLDAIQERFKISDGERLFLVQARRGEVLIRTSVESAIVQTNILPSEKALLIDKKSTMPKKDSLDLSKTPSEEG